MPKTRELGKEKKMDAQMRDDLMGGEVEKWIRVSRIPKPELCKLMEIGVTTLNERLRRPGEFRVQELREYYPPWEPPVSRFRATWKWYFPPSEPPQHIVAAHIFDFTINLLIVILGELLMQYHQIIYREVFLCLRRQKSEVFWNFWEKI